MCFRPVQRCITQEAPVLALSLLPIPNPVCLLSATGTPQEIHQEALRLESRLKHLQAGEARVAAVAADVAADPDGRMLVLLLKWRQQRLRAIEAELDRLKGVLHAAMQPVDAGVSEGVGTTS